LARTLFDIGIFSVLTSGGAVGVGWKLAFYVAGTTTPIITYNEGIAGSANSNPIIADASGRFAEAWIEQGQTIKWVLKDENDAVKVTVDDVLILADPPTFSASLADFLAGTATLPIANGGTNATAAANALANLGAFPAAGGIVTGNIVRSTKGVHPYFNSASMTGGKIYVQAAGADPTSNPGDWVMEY
jgi:hypothetical protein